MDYTDLTSELVNSLGVSQNLAIFLLAVLLIWTFIWKGLALWKSARKAKIIWFVVFLVVNTIGLLEILYIFVFSKLGQSKPKTKRKK